MMDELRNDIVLKQKKGLPFIDASVVELRNFNSK